MTKTCTKCHKQKDTTEFIRQSDGRHGVSGMCRDCKNIQQRQYWATKSQRAPESERCLHSTCPQRGNQLDEGHGFRFCEVHAPAARKVLDHPVGRAFRGGDGDEDKKKSKKESR